MPIYLCLIGVSRMYMGAHTLNEVLHGLLIGSTVATIAHIYVRPLFLREPALMYSAEEGGKYAVTFGHYLLSFLITFVLPMSIASLTLFARYDADETDLLTSKAW